MDTPAANSFAELSCSRQFRRRWPSVYEALQDGRPDRKALMKLYCQQINLEDRPILVGDHTAWPRPSAYTLADRTVEHQPTPIPGNRPITLGHGYSTLVWTPEKKGSWALPLLHERITSQETPFEKASQELSEVQKQLGIRAISLWDAEYGCAPFLLATEKVPTDKIIRLRPNLNLAGPPGEYKGQGRHPLHGEKFKFKEADTWKKPENDFEMQDEDLGKIRVTIWKDLHFRKAAACHSGWLVWNVWKVKERAVCQKSYGWLGSGKNRLNQISGGDSICVVTPSITGIVLPNNVSIGLCPCSARPNKESVGAI